MIKKKKTLWQRFAKNSQRAFTRPFKRREPEPLDEEAVIDLGEFTGLDRETIVSYASRDKGRRVSDEFDWVRPTRAEQYLWFYRASRTYMFLLGDPWERAVSLCRPGMRCLDFGGGAGKTSMGMAKAGAEVFFVDVGALNSSFLAFRARKRQLDITVIDPLVEVEGRWIIDTAEASARVGDFDLIVADNVLEHVPDYHLVLAKLAGALKPGGRLLECTPFKREKTYLFKRSREWSVHLTPSVSMAEAMERCGLKPVEDGPGGLEGNLWERTV